MMTWIRSLGLTAGALLVAAVVIQSQCARIRRLTEDRDAMMNRMMYAETVQKARADTIWQTVTVRPLNEPIQAPRAETIIERDTVEVPAGCPKSYLAFRTEEDWSRWYRLQCTGLIQGSDSTIWRDGRGARVDYRFAYGGREPSSERAYLVISPIGKPPPVNRLGWRGGLEIAGSSRGSVSIGADVTWRGWGPAVRGEVRGSDRPVLWVGLRRDL